MQEIRQMWVCAGVGCRLDRRTVFLGWKIFFCRLSFRLKAVCDEMKWQQIYSSSSKKDQIFNRFSWALFFINLLWHSKILLSFVLYHHRVLRQCKFSRVLGLLLSITIFPTVYPPDETWYLATGHEQIFRDYILSTPISNGRKSLQLVNINRNECSKCLISKKALSRLYHRKIMDFRQSIVETARNNRTIL